MNKYHRELVSCEGYNNVDIPADIFRYIQEFGLLSFKGRKEFKIEAVGREIGMVIFGGTCDINIDGKIYRNLGKRKNVFAGLPTGIYLPLGSKITIKSSGVEIGICSTLCEVVSEFAVIAPSEVKVISVGKDNWSREVRMIIGPDSPAVNLLVGETLNPPGNWSGTPPHRHENHSLPEESLHEELYYFKTERPQGFGIERLYSPERNFFELIPVKNNTITFMPWGYHQIVAGPGYLLYYMFFLAGKGKQLSGSVDPEHRWITDK